MNGMIKVIKPVAWQAGMRSLISFLAFSFLFSSVPCCAAFFDAGFGVRPEGMGGAFVAVADDANSILYNPSGSIRVMRSELALSYAKLFTGMGREVNLGLFHASYVRSINHRLGFGLAWTQFNSPNLKENTFVFNLALNPGAIFHLGRDLSVGGNAKRLERNYVLDDRTVQDPVFQAADSKNLYAYDLGAWSRPFPEFLPEITIGFALKNFNQPDVGLRTEEIVPMEAVGGLAFERGNLLFSFDFSRRSGKESYRGGIEARFFDHRFACRLGGNSSNGSLGLGYRQPFHRLLLSLDYAFIMPFQIQETAGAHRISFVLHR